jgi:hypothetical protein
MHAMDEQHLQWMTLLRDERDKREAARGLCSNPPTLKFRKALRDWFGSIGSALTMYQRALTDERTLVPPPLDILAACSNMMAYLAVGQIPKPMADAASEGRRPLGPTERRDIGLAVAYMMAASGGGITHYGEIIVISDRTPVKTVCEAFGVQRPTAQGWRRKIEPAFLGLHRIDGAILESLMRAAGERYKGAGRSTSAITKRGMRNRPVRHTLRAGNTEGK